ncbi:MAG: PDZ domain-containing protein [Actinomycetota bacterium]|nr:PDZ domain-containing protein [Actinomycetota bacterium]
MSRRVRTLLIAGATFVVLFVLALTLPVPYVILSPGPTFNTLGTDDSGSQIIVINGRTPNSTTGHLNMTTVDVSTQKISVFAALDGWLLHDQVVVPRSSVFPPGQSQQQVDQQNTQDFTQSQDDATVAAFCELGYTPKFGVVSVTGGTPAQGKLQPSDLLRSLDGQAVSTTTQLTAALAKDSPGQSVMLGVTRAGKPLTVTLVLAKPNAGSSGARIGIEVGSVCAAPFSVDLGLGNQIGGPSAGLMFALGIMDKVGTVDLTKGMFIAGTGTIDPSGKVGPIGGIALKMIAARRKGATVFLAPAGNCPDVSGATPKGLDVVKVDTLHDAVADLLDLQAGKAVPHC